MHCKIYYRLHTGGRRTHRDDEKLEEVKVAVLEDVMPHDKDHCFFYGSKGETIGQLVFEVVEPLAYHFNCVVSIDVGIHQVGVNDENFGIGWERA